MRVLLFLQMALLAAGIAAAQTPPPTIVAQQPAWGGYNVPQPVPYQPTLPQVSAAPAAPPTNTLAQPVVIVPQTVAEPNNGQVWMTPTSAANLPPENSIVAPGMPMIVQQEPIYPPTPDPGQQGSLLPPGTRSGVFQKAKFTATWLPQLNDDSLGWTDLRGEVMFGLPFFTRETPIVITPAYELHFLDRPESLDLPPRLHDLSIDFHHFRRLNEQWIFDAAVTPGLYADDHNLDSSDAFQISGRALGIYEASPQMKYVLGASYWPPGRSTVQPIAGIVYEPNDDWSYEIIYPQSKISWRLPNSVAPGSDEFWTYVKIEFAGGIWAIDDGTGGTEQFLYRDWRVLLGFEHKIIGDVSRRFEVGYVFNREYAFENGPTNIHLDPTLLLRVGLVY